MGASYSPTITPVPTPEALRALEIQLRMFREAHAGTAYSGFPSGQVSMVVMAPWWKSQLAAIMGSDFDNVGVAPLPRGEAGLATTAYTWFWAVDSSSPNQEEAWKFLQWLNSLHDPFEPSRMGTFLVQTGLIPGRPADVQANAEVVLDGFMAPFVHALEYSIPEPIVYRGQDIKIILQREIEAAWQGVKPPGNALLDAAADDASLPSTEVSLRVGREVLDHTRNQFVAISCMVERSPDGGNTQCVLTPDGGVFGNAPAIIRSSGPTG